MGYNQKYFNGKRILSNCELFSSGACNLKCTYCYIPKTTFLNKVHENILKRIEDGSFLQDLFEVYGEDLDGISHWGTEPTLTTLKFKDFYDKAFQMFPKLERIFLSSNFMTPPKNIVEFVNDIIPHTRKLKVVEIQISLDGPKWMTDVNRCGGSTEKIISNLMEVTKNINCFHPIKMHFKPTCNESQLEKLSEYDTLKEYYDFYDELMGRVLENVKGKDVTIQKMVDPSLAVPSNYTVQHGKFLKQLNDNILKLAESQQFQFIDRPEILYFPRFNSKVPYFREFFTKQHMFTCSAGDGSFGIGDTSGSLHSCHRAFYINHPEFVNACFEWGNLDPQTMQGLAMGRSKVMLKTNHADMGSEAEVIKTLYMNRSYHDFAINKVSIGVATLIELSKVGQVNPIYIKPALGVLMNFFIQTVNCQMDGIMTSGEMGIIPVSHYRLFGNGAFEQILNRYIQINKKVDNGTV